MSDKTGISWANATWNPITGCAKVSQGCKNCYALRDWARLAANPKTVYHGREFTDVRCHPERLDQPLRWTRSRLIFVNSMSDLFHEDVPDDFIDQVFAVMGNVFCKMGQPHVFQVLTKRPERMKNYLNDPETVVRVTRAMKDMGLHLAGENAAPTWPLPNVWLGVSVENQETADERIPLLLQTPAAVRWVSAEPLLGPVDLPGLFFYRTERTGGVEPLRKQRPPQIDWVVVGGESGPAARPMNPDWARSLRDQCAEAGVPYYFKQWGSWEPLARSGAVDALITMPGQNKDLWAWPGATKDGWRSGPVSVRVGRNGVSEALDGREHKEYPKPDGGDHGDV